MRILYGVIAAVALILAPVEASHARGFSLAEWIDALKGERGEADQNAARAIVWGAGYAYTIANVKLQQQGAQPLFCPPARALLPPRVHWQIVLDSHERYGWLLDLAPLREDIGSFHMVTLLLQGLVRAYPCSGADLDLPDARPHRRLAHLGR